MKFRQFLLLLAISMPLLLSAATKPEASCRPAEIIAGSLPRPREGVLWSAVGNGFTEWKVTGPGTLSLGDEYYLWDDQAARVEFSGKGRVTLAPNPAITIEKPVSGVSFWVICPPSGKTNNLLQIKDAKGKKFTIKTRNNSSYWANNPWWCTSSFLIPAKAEFPVTITGIAFEAGKDIKSGDALHFDYLQTFDIKDVDYPQELLETAGDYLTTPDTILPTPPQGDYTTNVVQEGDAFRFSYKGADGTLQYIYTPKTGTFSDLSASFDGKEAFAPMKEGGVHVSKNGVVFSPADAEVTATLLSSELTDGVVKASWRLEKKDAAVEVAYTFALKARTLLITADCKTPDVTALDCGIVNGLRDPRLFDLTYLHYRWDYPRLLVNDDCFVSLFPDWYTGNASDVVDGNSSRELQGARVIDDHSARILGGVLYLPKNRSERNPLHERLFLTVSPALEDVMPNLPNPKSKYFDTMKGLVCHTRMYAVTEPKHIPTELAYETLFRDYGLKDIFLRTHFNEFRSPLYSNSFTFSIHANQAAGGDELIHPYYEEMRKIFPFVGPYQDNRCIHPFAYPYFDHSLVFQWSDDTIMEGWDSNYQLNHLAQRMIFKDFTPKFTAAYPWNACYLDEVTNTPPWGMVDYNPRTPGAATYRAVLLNYGSLLQEMQNYYQGPIWSEGNADFFWCGCLDTDYAQCNQPDEIPLADFKLRKMNPLENLNGYDLTRETEDIHYLLSAQIVHGNIGHLWGGKVNTVLGEYNPQKLTPQTLRAVIKSYYMMRQLQELYAGVPVETIQYQCGEDLLTATEMLRQNRQNEGKVYECYKNGLEIWVNRNPESSWTVDVDGTEMTLPHFGFAAVLPGEFLEYAAEFDGHLVDYVSGPMYTYMDANGAAFDFPELSAANAYAILPEENGAQRLIPVPFIEEESIGGLDAQTVTPLDQKGNAIGDTENLDLVDAGKGRFTLRKEAFQWRLK